MAERPRLCACCEAISASKRQQVAELRGKTAVVTGGRALGHKGIYRHNLKRI